MKTILENLHILDKVNGHEITIKNCEFEGDVVELETLITSILKGISERYDKCEYIIR